MSALTTSLASPSTIRFVSLLGISLSLVASLNCGAKSAPPRRGVPASPSPPPAAPAPAGIEPVEDALTLAPGGPNADFLSRLAPPPRIRVGLSTSAEAVRLTSSRPFRVGDGIEWVGTQDVLLEPAGSATNEASVFRVQVASFPFRRDATALAGELRESLDEPVRIAREAGTGRYAVRLGSFGTSAGARAAGQDLLRAGYQGLSIVSEPAVRKRPEWIALELMGRSSLRARSLVLKAVPSGPGAWIEVDGRPYRGFIEISVNDTNLFTIVNVVNVEDYLKGVVPAELSPEIYPQEEALKAQAIAARTYAVKRAGQFASEGYDICATAACQVYRGQAIEHELSNAAVSTTAGEILTFGGEPVDALYTSTCGGRTESSENVFSEPTPYLVSRACFAEPRFAPITTRDTNPLPLEAAVLRALGVVGAEASRSWLREPALERETETWIATTLRILGQRSCRAKASEGTNGLNGADFSVVLADALCWTGRLPFLLPGLDSERLVPDTLGLDEGERRALAYAIHTGLFLPESDGLGANGTMARGQVLETLYRLVERQGSPPLRTATVVRVEGERIVLRDEDDSEISSFLSPSLAIYSSAPGATYYQPKLVLLANDEVRFHQDDEGIDILVLVTPGATFDRESRFSHWTVRTSNEDLSRRIDAAHSVGTIVDLRPLRFGRSGRVAEIEIVGTERSVELKGLAIRRALGTRETLFFIDAQRGANGSVEHWVFTGRGWGHGVGLCQVGAYGMAASGYDYRQILAHYYVGTEVQSQRTLAAFQNN